MVRSEVAGGQTSSPECGTSPSFRASDVYRWNLHTYQCVYVESRKNGTDEPICRAGIET